MNTKKKRFVRSACVFCCALLFFCVCAFYFVYKTRTDIRVKKTINYIMQVLVELEAKKTQSAFAISCRENYEYFIEEILAKERFPFDGVVLSSFAVMSVEEELCASFWWINFKGFVSSVAISTATGEENVVVEIPKFSDKRFQKEEKQLVSHGYFIIVSEGNALYNFLSKLKDGDVICVDFFDGEKKIGVRSSRPVKVVDYRHK